MKTVLTQGVLSLLLVAGSQLPAGAFTHPGMPLTDADLTFLNTNKNTAPWSVGYGSFKNAGEYHTKLSYNMAGPRTEVGRTPDINRAEFSSDMKAIQGLALQWKFTGDPAYAEKAKGILLAWATTHTSWSGAEAYLDAGDYIDLLTMGASILRSYSGWTAADTTTVKNYLSNVWASQGAVPGPLRSANQGALQLKTAMGVAVYCDDTTRFDQCVSAFRTDACAALPNTFSNGQFGDMGRDQGHAYGQLQSLSWVAEVAWKAAGVDLYSVDNNRLAACAEYFCDYNNGGSPAFIKSGTCYGLYDTIGGGRLGSTGTQGLHLLHGAYVTRKGMSMPELTTFRDNCTDAWNTWIYRKTVDNSTATIPTETYTYPSTSTVTMLTAAQVGIGLAGSVSNSGGTWTVAGSGRDIYGPASDGHYFAYQQRTGDFAMVAQVTDETGSTNAGAEAGVMVREDFSPTGKMLAVMVKATGGVQATQRGAASADHGTQFQSHPAATLPYWVKVERRGNALTTYDSPDGVNWTAVLNTVYATAPTVYVGLCVTSHDAAQLHTATFTDVQITGGSPVNRATGGTATASWQNSPNEGAAKAFDGLTSTKWYNYTPGTAYSPTGWLKYQLPTPRTVYQYKVSSANDVPSRDPKDWQFQGSNDGTTWTDLDTQSNQAFSARFQTKTYDVINYTAYRYYRLNITANKGGPAYGLQLSEFALMAD